MRQVRYPSHRFFESLAAYRASKYAWYSSGSVPCQQPEALAGIGSELAARDTRPGKNSDFGEITLLGDARLPSSP